MAPTTKKTADKKSSTSTNGTKRLFAKKTIKQHDAEYELLIQNIQAAVVVHGSDTQIVTSNTMAQKLLGLTEDQLLGKTAIDPAWHFLREDGSIMPQEEYPVNQVFCTKKSLRDFIAGIFRPAANDYVWTLVNADPLCTSQGKIDQVIVTFVDITERKRIEESLHIANQYNRSLIEASLDPLVTIDAHGKITDVNAATEKVTGYTRTELIGTDFTDYFSEPEKARAGYQKVFEAGFVRDYALEIRHRDGHLTAVLYNASVYKDTAGRVIGVFAAARNITERKQSERALQESKEKYRALLETSTDIILTHDIAGRITYINQSGLRITEYSEADLIGSNITTILPPEEIIEMEKRALARRHGEVGTYEYETKFISKSGKHVSIDVRSTPIIREGQGTEFLINARDITEQKIAEKANAKLAAIIETSDDAIMGKNLDGDIESWNAGAEHLYGYTAEEIIGKNVSLLALPARKNEVKDILDKIIKGERVRHFETDRVRKDGSVFSISLTVSPMKDASGKIIGASSIARDVTEQKRIKENLRIANIYTRSLIEASLDPLVTINAEGKITDVNAATEKVTGRARQELIGTDFSEYFTEPEKARLGYQEVFKEGFVHDYALEICNKDGHHTPVLYNASVYKDEHGTVIGVFAAARDITERKRFEENLRLANIYTRSLIEASLDPLVTISAEGKITDVNAATEKVTGFTRTELIGTDFSDYFSEPEKARLGYQEVFEKGFVQDYALEIRHKTGGLTPVLYNATVYKNESGQVMGVFAAARDITESNRIQQEIQMLNDELELRVFQRTSQLEAANKELEAFAYSVSHDLRAPLRSIDGFSHILLDEYAQHVDEQGKDCLLRIRSAAQRMAQLIDDILDLSRITRAELNTQTVNLSDIAFAISNDLRTAQPERNVEFTIQKDVSVRGDIRLLKVALENLLRNAWKFTSKHAAAHIEFGKMKHDGIETYFVRDNGAGFDMTYAAILFGAFQRLHSATEFPGTGIGLATVQRIIHKHGGKIWAEGKIEQGATFYFTIP